MGAGSNAGPHFSFEGLRFASFRKRAAFVSRWVVRGHALPHRWRHKNFDPPRSDVAALQP
jgi:hypothetical protein